MIDWSDSQSLEQSSADGVPVRPGAVFYYYFLDHYRQTVINSVAGGVVFEADGAIVPECLYHNFDACAAARQETAQGFDLAWARHLTRGAGLRGWRLLQHDGKFFLRNGSHSIDLGAAPAGGGRADLVAWLWERLQDAGLLVQHQARQQARPQRRARGIHR